MKLYKILLVTLSMALLGGCATTASEKSTIPSQTQAVKSDVGTLKSANIRWHLGDEWHYSDGYVLKVEKVEGKVARLLRIDQGLTGTGLDWIEREGLFKIKSRTKDSIRQVIFRSPDPASLFPLKVGGHVAFKREYLMGKKKFMDGSNLDGLQKKQLRVHQTSWAVTGKERVSVPAGTFDCWVLEWNTKSELSNWSGSEKWWYSPKVGNFVRMEYKYGKKPASSRVLMKYSKGK